jgi:predicted DNA-binding protein (UPF0251 family)
MSDQARRPVRRVVRRISPEVFERVVKPRLQRLNPARMEAVRCVMVEGVRWVEAAAMPGVALSALSKAVAKGWRAVDESTVAAADATSPSASVQVDTRHGLPPGWVSLHLVVPESVLPGVRALVDAAAETMRQQHARRLAALKGGQRDDHE